MKKENSIISFITEYIKDLSFENPRAPVTLSVQEPIIKFAMDLNFNYLGEEEERLFEVLLSMKVDATYEEKSVFIIELTYGGLFNLSAIDEDDIQRVLHVDCASLLFPYVRTFIAQITQNGGFRPLRIEPINFIALYESKIQNKPTE